MAYYKPICSLCGKFHATDTCPAVQRTLRLRERKDRQDQNDSREVDGLLRQDAREEERLLRLDRKLCKLQKKLDGTLPRQARKEPEDTRRENRKIQTLLSREKAVRRNLLETTTDGAGVEWRMDETGWWWWRDDEGEWQWTKIPYTPHAPKPRRPQRRRAASPRAAPSEPTPSEPTPSEPTPSEPDSVTSEVSTGLSIDDDREARTYEQKLLSESSPLTAVEETSAVQLPVATSKTQEPTLKYMVTAIREELELEDSLTLSQVIAEANRQLALPAAGSLAQQARSIHSQLTWT